jgi:hypothetical protein
MAGLRPGDLVELGTHGGDQRWRLEFHGPVCGPDRLPGLSGIGQLNGVGGGAAGGFGCSRPTTQDKQAE